MELGISEWMTSSTFLFQNDMKASTLTAGGALTIGALMMTVAFISPSSASFGRGENSNSGSGNFAQMRELSDSIERSVENIDNGVIITMTSDDADAVEMLQSREAKGPQNDDVTRTQENIDNGVRITITSDDEDTVAKFKNMLLKAKVLNLVSIVEEDAGEIWERECVTQKILHKCVNLATVLNDR